MIALLAATTVLGFVALALWFGKLHEEQRLALGVLRSEHGTLERAFTTAHGITSQVLEGNTANLTATITQTRKLLEAVQEIHEYTRRLDAYLQHVASVALGDDPGETVSGHRRVLEELQKLHGRLDAAVDGSLDSYLELHHRLERLEAARTRPPSESPAHDVLAAMRAQLVHASEQQEHPLDPPF